jgi:hypothetical protein
VKLVEPPFIPERAHYYRREIARDPRASLAPVGQFMFWWAGRLEFESLSSGKGTVASAVSACGDLERFDVEIDEGLKYRPLEGDWIVRKDAPRDKRMAALREILRRRLGRDIKIERRTVEREVVVVTGDLPAELPGGGVQAYTDPRDLRDEPSGGGGGTLRDLFDSLGSALDRKMIDETRSGGRRIAWRWYRSASAAEGDENRTRQLLAHVSRQTGLTFTRRAAEVEVWKVSDEAEGKTGL